MTKIERGDLVMVSGNQDMPAQITWRGQNAGDDASYIKHNQGILATVDNVRYDIVDIILGDGRIGWTILRWITKIEQGD
jgi:hypothetical protein